MREKQRIEESRDIIIEAFGSSVGVYGMNETIGRIYGLLYFEEEPLGLEKIADKLGVSKATISINIRLLLDLKMVQKVWQKGSRKDFYVAESDFEKILQEVLRNKELKQAVLIKESIARALEGYKSIIRDEIEGDINEIAHKDMEKVEYLLSWTNKSLAWINFFLEANISEGPSEDLQEIEVDWG